MQKLEILMDELFTAAKNLKPNIRRAVFQELGAALLRGLHRHATMLVAEHRRDERRRERASAQ